MRRKNAACHIRHHPENIVAMDSQRLITRGLSDPSKYDVRDLESKKLLHRFDEQGLYLLHNRERPDMTWQDLERLQLWIREPALNPLTSLINWGKKDE